MEQRVSLITLVVNDLAVSRSFYLDGLGWIAEFEAPDEVLMIRVGERLLLSLWDRVTPKLRLGRPPPAAPRR